MQRLLTNRLLTNRLPIACLLISCLHMERDNVNLTLSMPLTSRDHILCANIRFARTGKKVRIDIDQATNKITDIVLECLLKERLLMRRLLKRRLLTERLLISYLLTERDNVNLTLSMPPTSREFTYFAPIFDLRELKR